MLKKYRQTLTPIIFSISLCVLTTLLYLQIFPAAKPALQRLNALSYDLRMRATVTGVPSDFPPIFIIDIDERSLEQEGRWPWSRHRLAVLIEKLHQAGTAVIALDIALTEPEENPVDLVQAALPDSKPELSASLEQLKPQLDGDRQLAETLRDKGVILGYLFHVSTGFIKGTLKPALVDSDAPMERLTSLTMAGYTANLQILATAAAQNGFITIRQDDDGVARRSSLLFEHDRQLYTSLAVEAAKLYLGANEEPMALVTAETGDVRTITHVAFAGQQIPTDASGQILIPYMGQQGTFAYISAASVLADQSFPDLTDAIVLIGTSAQALFDLRTTPLQASYPGVEIQATLIHALLNPALIPYTPDWQDGATILLMVVLSLIMILLFPMLRPLNLIITAIVMLTAVVVFNIWLWVGPRINLDVVLPLLLIILTSTVFVLHRLFSEHNERQRIHQMFGQYVPVDHIDRILTDRNMVSMDGERREMTVLFSDIRNFTAISEHLSTQQLKQFLNTYLTPITEIIFNRQGTIDKYIGDLVMAFWGAPLADPQHAPHAVQAALEMRRRTHAMQEAFNTLGLNHVVQAGIGVHTGMMNVGDMGSDYRRAYTVLGDAVNLGSRLESLTKQYGILILVSAETVKQCPEINFREVDYVRVKGRNEPVRIYEPIDEYFWNEIGQTQDLTAHKRALQAYYDGDWVVASDLFSALQNETHDPLYQVYLQRIQSADTQAPEDWDGVYTHSSK